MIFLNYLGNNIAVDPHTEKTRRCHVDRSGDISYIVFRDPSSLCSVGMTLLGQYLYYHFFLVRYYCCQCG